MDRAEFDRRRSQQRKAAAQRRELVIQEAAWRGQGVPQVADDDAARLELLALRVGKRLLHDGYYVRTAPGRFSTASRVRPGRGLRLRWYGSTPRVEIVTE